MSAMTKEYGPEKGERVFYASRNAGKISGVEKGKKADGGKTPKWRDPELIGPDWAGAKLDQLLGRKSREDYVKGFPDDSSPPSEKRGGRARKAKGGKTAEKPTFPGPFSEDYDELYEKPPKKDVGKAHGGRARKRADR
jgi:hypothetical protein